MVHRCGVILKRGLSTCGFQMAFGQLWSLLKCPFPYKRLITPELLRWCAETGRFRFLKDTSCDVLMIKSRLAAVQGTGLKIFNANSATLLETLKLGVHGYSGVMANFHPELYVWLVNHWNSQPKEADHLMNILSMASLIEKELYPVNVKYASSVPLPVDKRSFPIYIDLDRLARRGNKPPPKG